MQNIKWQGIKKLIFIQRWHVFRWYWNQKWDNKEMLLPRTDSSYSDALNNLCRRNDNPEFSRVKWDQSLGGVNPANSTLRSYHHWAVTSEWRASESLLSFEDAPNDMLSQGLQDKSGKFIQQYVTLKNIKLSLLLWSVIEYSLIKLRSKGFRLYDQNNAFCCF